MALVAIRGCATHFRCLRKIQFGKIICYSLLAVAALEFVLLNIFVIYAYKFVSKELSQIRGLHFDDTLFQKLHNNDKVRSLVSSAREGGFLSILQDTVHRLYIVKEQSSASTHAVGKPSKGLELKDLYTFGLDVSHSGEATFIYKRILSRKEFPYTFLIVDIGANDGFIASNSFNFIQMGWDAVLVEPQIDQVKLAKKNLKRYVEVNRKPPHKVNFVQAAIGNKDGHVYFMKNKVENQESHVLTPGDSRLGEDGVIQVPSITIKTIARKYSIPKNFAILSVDAEGMGLEILKQWFALGFHPAYIVFEKLHIREPWSYVTDLFASHHYVIIGARGWNFIFEHQPPHTSVPVQS